MGKEKVKVFGEGEHLFFVEEKKTKREKEENIWKSDKQEEKRRGEVFGEGKYIFCGGEEKGRWKRKIYFLCPLISLEVPRDLLRSL